MLDLALALNAKAMPTWSYSDSMSWTRLMESRWVELLADIAFAWQLRAGTSSDQQVPQLCLEHGCCSAEQIMTGLRWDTQGYD